MGKVLRGALSSLIWTMIISGTRPCSSRYTVCCAKRCRLCLRRHDYGCPLGGILFELFDRELLIAVNYIGTSTFVNRRSMVDRFAGFDEALRTLEDWESDSEIYGLCARLSPSDPCTNDLSVIEPKDAAIERIRHVTNGAVPASLRQLSSLGFQNSM
jgi:hypothetical protein